LGLSLSSPLRMWMVAITDRLLLMMIRRKGRGQ